MIKKALLYFYHRCSNDDENDFNYPLEAIYGTWDATHIKVKGEWVDITGITYQQFAMSATLYSNSTYSGEDYFGTVSGTYKAIGSNIITYINGDPYLTYKIISLDGANAEVTMSMGSSSTTNARLKKR